MGGRAERAHRDESSKAEHKYPVQSRVHPSLAARQPPPAMAAVAPPAGASLVATKPQPRSSAAPSGRVSTQRPGGERTSTAAVAVEWRLSEAPEGSLIPFEDWERTSLKGTLRGPDGVMLGSEVVVRCKAGLLDFQGLTYSRELGAWPLQTGGCSVYDSRTKSLGPCRGRQLVRRGRLCWRMRLGRGWAAWLRREAAGFDRGYPGLVALAAGVPAPLALTGRPPPRRTRQLRRGAAVRTADRGRREATAGA